MATNTTRHLLRTLKQQQQQQRHTMSLLNENQWFQKLTSPTLHFNHRTSDPINPNVDINM